MEDVSVLLQAGADKISVNSAAIKNHTLINDLAHQFGSQCVVAAMDIKFEMNDWYVYLNGGRVRTELKAKEWAKQVADSGAGEILLTSMDNDGTEKGFALEITAAISSSVNVPVIASGGAGCMEDFVNVFTIGKADGALAASVFHFKEIAIPELKKYLKNNNIKMRI